MGPRYRPTPVHDEVDRATRYRARRSTMRRPTRPPLPHLPPTTGRRGGSTPLPKGDRPDVTGPLPRRRGAGRQPRLLRWPAPRRRPQGVVCSRAPPSAVPPGVPPRAGGVTTGTAPHRRADGGDRVDQDQNATAPAPWPRQEAAARYGSHKGSTSERCRSRHNTRRAGPASRATSSPTPKGADRPWSGCPAYRPPPRWTSRGSRPCSAGMTWSMVSAGSEQYTQRPPSRRSTDRLVTGGRARPAGDPHHVGQADDGRHVHVE